MKYRVMGRTGIELSEIGYGAWGLGGQQWRGGSDAESFRALGTSFDLGINFIDTALAYGDGHSEKIVGEAVRQSSLPILIATKIPPANRVWPARSDSQFSSIFPKDYVIACTETSFGTSDSNESISSNFTSGMRSGQRKTSGSGL